MKVRKAWRSEDGHNRTDLQVDIKRAPPGTSSGLSWEKGRRYGIVIDAGSSGSRVQIYSWLDHAVAKEQRLTQGSGIAVLPKIEKGVEEGEGWTTKVEPGGQIAYANLQYQTAITDVSCHRIQVSPRLLMTHLELMLTSLHYLIMLARSYRQVS